MKLIIAVMTAMLTFFALTMIANASPTKPLTSCLDTGAAVAGTPYQIPGPTVVYPGRSGCNGGSFRGLKTHTIPVVDLVDDFNNDLTITCNSGVSPCYANTQAPKRLGCHNYQTTVVAYVDMGDGKGYQLLDTNTSHVWNGCRRP